MVPVWCVFSAKFPYKPRSPNGHVHWSSSKGQWVQSWAKSGSFSLLATLTNPTLKPPGIKPPVVPGGDSRILSVWTALMHRELKVRMMRVHCYLSCLDVVHVCHRCQLLKRLWVRPLFTGWAKKVSPSMSFCYIDYHFAGHFFDILYQLFFFWVFQSEFHQLSY